VRVTRATSCHSCRLITLTLIRNSNYRQREFIGLMSPRMYRFLFFVAPIAWLLGAHYFSPWNFAFNGESILYRFNVLLRLGTLLSFAAILLSTGLVFSNAFKAKEKNALLDLDNLFRGAALWTMIVFVLGTFSWLYFEVLLFLSAIFLLLAWFSTDSPWKKIGRVELWSFGPGCIMVVFFGFYFLTLGVTPFTHSNDLVGHYLPYLQSVSGTHSILPGKWHFHFFYSKGAGLFHFATVLSDVQSVQLMSLLMVSGMIVASCRFLSQEFQASRWEIVYFLFMLFLGKVFQAEFSKTHLLVVSFFVYFALRSFQSFARSPSALEVTSLGLCLLCLAVMSPLSVPFAVLWLMLLWIAFDVRQRAGRRLFLLLVASSAASVVFILGYNYLLSGFLEITPPIMSTIFDPVRVARWADPVAILLQSEWIRMQMLHDGPAAGGCWTSLFWGQPMLFINLLLLAVSLFACVKMPVERRLAATVVIFHLFIAVLALVVRGNSIQRLTLFCTPLGVLASIALIRVLGAEIERRWHFRCQPLALMALFFLCLILSINSLPVSPNWPFLFGSKTYADLYDPEWKVKDAIEIQRRVPEGHRINILSALYGFTLMPGSAFERVDSPSYLRSFSTIMYGPAQTGQAALQNEKVDYALIAPDAITIYSSLAPAYALDQLGKSLKAEKMIVNGRTYYLIKITDATAADDAAELVPIWRDLLAQLKKTAQYTAYENCRK